MQLRPPHFHFSNICLFFTTLSFSRERHLLCRPLGPQNSFLKRKKVKLLLPSPISILGQPPLRKEISTPLSSTELKWCQHISKSGFLLPNCQSFYSKTCFRIWTLDFFVIFSNINLFRGAYQMGRGQTFSSSRQDHCWQNKDELVFESLSAQKLFIKKLRGDYWWFSGAGEQDKDSCWRRSETK